MEDAEEIIKLMINIFEAWLEVVLMRGPDKRKYGELIYDLSIQYEIRNNRYLKTFQEAVDVMRKAKFKSENNSYKSNTKNKQKRWW